MKICSLDEVFCYFFIIAIFSSFNLADVTLTVSTSSRLSFCQGLQELM